MGEHSESGQKKKYLQLNMPKTQPVANTMHSAQRDNPILIEQREEDWQSTASQM